MFDRIGTSGAPAATAMPRFQPARILKMEASERTAGSMPVWEESQSSAGGIEKDMEIALAGGGKGAPANALAYNPSGNQTNGDAGQAEKEFGFADLLDMVNPLQHIPVVGHIYRALTGDQIRPIGGIIGGALFGGPLGAAGGIINAIAVNETGKDLTGNALSMFGGPGAEEKPDIRIAQPDAGVKPAPERPQKMAASADDDLPGALLAFVDLGGGGVRFERAAQDARRTGPSLSV